MISVLVLLSALSFRIDPGRDLTVPLSSSLNLEVLGAILCLAGSFVCLRASGPVFRMRAKAF